VQEYRAVRLELSAQETRTAEIRKAAKRVPVGVPRAARETEAGAEEIKLAQLALKRLALPWDELFSALESARTDGAALLAVEPDPGKSVVKLTAEAKSAEDMLNYIERLQTTAGLDEVTLARHQINIDDQPQMPHQDLTPDNAIAYSPFRSGWMPGRAFAASTVTRTSLL